MPNKETGLVELHSWAGINPSPGSPPSAPKTKAIALVGDVGAGLLELTSVEDPHSIDDDVDVEWTSFTLNSSGSANNTVTYAGPGGWVAFKSERVGGGEGWVVRWKLRK